MDVDEFLAHHGVKGMHWGVRKDRSSSSVGERPPANHTKLKKAAKVGGAVVLTAAVVAGSVYLAKHPELLQKVMDSNRHHDPVNVKKGKEFVETLVKEEPELTGPIHIARGKYDGYKFLMKGGLSEPVLEAEKAGHGNHGLKSAYKRYGKNLEKVGVSFPDPHGRTDHAGRIIEHQVVLPEHHAKGIDSYEKARDKAWELVKDNFNPFYEKSLIPPWER